MVTGTLKVERAKTSKPRTDSQFLPAHRRTPHRRNDRATRTDTPRAAPKTIAEKWRIGSGFDHSSPARERGPGRHTCIGVSKICTVSFARRLPRVVARRLFQTILPDRKAITFHLRRI
jgi:hypothetical protein